MGTQRDFDGAFGHGISVMGFFCAKIIGMLWGYNWITNKKITAIVG
jgi:hypothetical protein